jgi:hypothetical protein
MNCEKFSQKLKVEVDDQKMPIDKLFIAGWCRHFHLAARCWGPKQVFNYDSDLHQARLLFTKTDPLEKI